MLRGEDPAVVEHDAQQPRELGVLTSYETLKNNLQRIRSTYHLSVLLPTLNPSRSKEKL